MSRKNLKGFRNKKQQVKTAEGRKMSSIKWLNRNLNDPYVTLAKTQGLRSRAAFKLKEIIEKYPLLKRARTIVDLGCAPGGWLQVLQGSCKGATIIGVDLKEVAPVAGVELIVGDFLEETVSNLLHSALDGKQVDLVLSDMAANASGDREIDHFRNIELIEAALEFAQLHLKPGGHFVAKLLRGREDQKLLVTIRQYFKSVRYFKPPSSYSDSSEVFLVALEYRGSDSQ